MSNRKTESGIRMGKGRQRLIMVADSAMTLYDGGPS